MLISVIILMCTNIIFATLLIFAYTNLSRLYNHIQEQNQDLAVYEENFKIVLASAHSLLENMRGIDIRGSFESDDEVGSTFTELKTLVERFNDTTNMIYASKEEEK